MKKEIKNYLIDFDEEKFDSGIDMIAITENPAIELFALRFNSEVKMEFKVDNEKQIIAGPAIVPNKKIMRYDEKTDTYYTVEFTQEVIERMVEKFNSEIRDRKFNLEHDNNYRISGFIKESYIIKDTELNNARFYGFDNLEVGTWFIEAKIDDKEVWDNVIKKMTKVGFSIEGLMGAVGFDFSKIDNKVKIDKDLVLDKIVDKLGFSTEELLDLLNKKNNKIEMKKIKVNFTSLTKNFNKVTKKFEIVETVDEKELEVSELVEGAEVLIEGEVAPDGSYETENEVIVVEEGKIEEIVEKEDESTELEEDKKEDMEDDVQDENEDQFAELVRQMAELSARIDKLESKGGEEDVEEMKTSFKKLGFADLIVNLKN
jgi:hypothetical protein